MPIYRVKEHVIRREVRVFRVNALDEEDAEAHYINGGELIAHDRDEEEVEDLSVEYETDQIDSPRFRQPVSNNRAAKATY